MAAERKNKNWLQDSEVRYNIKCEKGRWKVSLIFVDIHNPSHFLIREMGDYHSERLARIYAENMQKTAAKDARGTQKVKINAYHINNN